MLRRHFIKNPDNSIIIKITYTADSQQFFCTEENGIKEGDVLRNALYAPDGSIVDDINEYLFLKEDYDVNSKIGNWYFTCKTSPNTIATGFQPIDSGTIYSVFLCKDNQGTPREFTQLEISEGVENIKAGFGIPGLFGANNEYLNTIILPQSLKYIDDSAFLGFNSIVNVIGGDNLEYITNIQINDNTMYQVFGMGFAESLYIMTNQYSKGKVLFKVKIESNVKVPENFNQYYPTLFLGGEEIIETIELPDNFTEIYPMMCGYMLNLNTINLSNVISIGEKAFYGCTNLKYVDLSNVTSIGNRAFADSGIEEFKINDNILLDNIGSEIFMDCKNLKVAILPINYTPAGTANINILMYRGCTSIETVYFNSKTCSGTNELFSESSDTIKSVIFGEFVTKICQYAFRYSPLENIIYKGTMEQWNSISKITNWCQYAVTTVVHCTDGDVEL